LRDGEEDGGKAKCARTHAKKLCCQGVAEKRNTNFSSEFLKWRSVNEISRMHDYHGGFVWRLDV